jgi:hypothetical protein
MLVKKYGVTKSGSNKQVAQRIMKIRIYPRKNIIQKVSRRKSNL